MKCRNCEDRQQVAEYLHPNGLRVFVMYKCQICGHGKQENHTERLSEETKKASKAPNLNPEGEHLGLSYPLTPGVMCL